MIQAIKNKDVMGREGRECLFLFNNALNLVIMCQTKGKGPHR